jgi:hypothetical protein
VKERARIFALHLLVKKCGEVQFELRVKCNCQLHIKVYSMNFNVTFTNLFWYRTLHVSDRFTVHHQESSTVYTAIGMCHTG